MKRYACKFCKKWTTRKEARDCIKTHIRIDKGTRTKKHPGRNGKELFVSNVTEFMLREEI